MLRGYVSEYLSCRDCGRTTQKGYVEILEFTHFVEFFSFNRIAENHKEKRACEEGDCCCSVRPRLWEHKEF